MALWPEIGAALILASALWAWAGIPASHVAIHEAASMEGQRVTMVGWPEQFKTGDDWTRLTLREGDHGIRVYMEGVHENRDGPVVVTGRLERARGHLVLYADEVQWSPLS